MQDITEPTRTVEGVGGDRREPRKKLLVTLSRRGSEPRR